MKINYLLSLLLFFNVLFVRVDVYAQTIRQNETGVQDGFYYSFWNDTASGTASVTLKPKGRYTTKWTHVGNFTTGKGWQTGKEDRLICYSGRFDGGKNGFLALYGWTKDSLIEYYVVENYGEWTPPGGNSIGSFESDGGTYNIYKTLRVNQPSIIGNTTFHQYWSVRTIKRSKRDNNFC